MTFIRRFSIQTTVFFRRVASALEIVSSQGAIELQKPTPEHFPTTTRGGKPTFRLCEVKSSWRRIPPQCWITTRSGRGRNPPPPGLEAIAKA